ncbi:hypothetical protein SAMN06296036_14814 [Pseudobacteriovorax antillogorgiicola]|uniref:Uncharacterized protein n=1 Tax=Pseudobacteriovorax antillogorgiicola TaxID=1513793 RepID=A0A1Y6CYU3_9BACT|nr:hypothetical protein EDD56_1481 [Pseudobacteriovorax antillogorgiicola]SMF83663.1 hypothetical protein SAMN06296036_14814 [Pseudobacteriovorax antillogorgiicola]
MRVGDVYVDDVLAGQLVDIVEATLSGRIVNP